MKRRKFITQTGTLALSPFLANLLVSCGNNTTSQDSEYDGISQFGLQLWTVKEDMAADVKGTLEKVAQAGFTYVESYNGAQGPFWGMAPADFKALLADLGLSVPASHINSAYTLDLKLEDQFKALAGDAASIGIKYLSNPFPGEIKTKEEWFRVAEGLNRQGRICVENGLKMGYHNHHSEFIPFEDGTLPYTLLLENTDPEKVDFELDIYWAVKAGQNPEQWFNDYGKRIKLCHVKDLHKNEAIAQIEKTEGPATGFWPLGASCVLGTGQIDYPQILKTAKANGIEYFIVEQERFDNSTPLEDIVKDAQYMKDFRFAS
jgi:sugar phosphate isomerase/epimerase